MSDQAPPEQLTDIAVIGASAGGVEALQRLVPHLPADLRIPILVIVHTPAAGASVLPQILQRRTGVPCVPARDGAALTPGIHVAPADHHLLVEDGRLRLSRSPRENGTRPAIDPTLRSVAAEHGSRAAGVILSGTRDDGARGMRAVQAAGGRVAVQDPDDALFPAMPRNAMELVEPDAVLLAAEVPAWLLGTSRAHRAPRLDDLPAVTSLTELPQGQPTRITCPDCGGVLFEAEEGPASRFRCSVGHEYSPGALVAADGQAVEHAMWVAARALQDRMTLLQGMAHRAGAGGHHFVAEGFARQARDVQEQFDLLQALLEREPSVDTDEREARASAA